MERRNFFKRLFSNKEAQPEQSASAPHIPLGSCRPLGGSNAYIGEIQMVGLNFAPVGWAFCNGQLLAIGSNTALFAILGTTYGGNGQTNFALPDLRGTFPMHQGQGAGLSVRSLGENGGSETVTLNASNIPPLSISGIPNVTVRGTGTQGVGLTTGKQLGAATINSNAPFPTAVPNMPPYLVVNFIICLNGVFPPRN